MKNIGTLRARLLFAPASRPLLERAPQAFGARRNSAEEERNLSHWRAGTVGRRALLGPRRRRAAPRR
eukprot:2761269-Alexandrium_andersonii.AAC.1